VSPSLLPPRRLSNVVERLARRDHHGDDELAVTAGRHDAPQELEKVRSEERVTVEVCQPEGSSVHHRDFLEPDVVELLEERWRRQRARQSTSKGGGTLQDLLGQCFREDEVGDGQAAPRAQHAHGLGQDAALASGKIQYAVGDDDVD
jgi:hypothetical protein